ncbi:hypothetical protein D8Y22_10850 [Salinadaptatus halalkaliphilus]|uniref:Uncharacterized protein n=1 Tax=Salinadaptatus halalkaliphilus TaxID=2419781 RepID=A0A4S3TL44_9EURY|nr:DUF6293 family protein [Salinadaptatus halalkaliphilus]THE64861.1 hypothetical protein D8Y22_10850 [Salinadaptatus halalkaliphilus]
MDVVKRVHIAALGYEYDRILEPIRDQRADLVYLLEDPDHLTTAYHDELVAELEAVVPAVETLESDLTDVYAVLGDVTTIASHHADDVVAVNVSSAGAIPAIGMTIACMDASTNAQPYYVEPATYAHDGSSEPTSFGADRIDELPIYPMESPTTDQVAIMGFLADPAAWDGYHDDRTAPPKKKDLIEYARDVGLSFMADRQSPGDGEDKGAFRVLDIHVVEPLVADGYVTVESVGRRRVVSLTDRGENAYRAFRHKLAELDDIDAVQTCDERR